MDESASRNPQAPQIRLLPAAGHNRYAWCISVGLHLFVVSAAMRFDIFQVGKDARALHVSAPASYDAAPVRLFIPLFARADEARATASQADRTHTPAETRIPMAETRTPTGNVVTAPGAAAAGDLPDANDADVPSSKNDPHFAVKRTLVSPGSTFAPALKNGPSFPAAANPHAQAFERLTRELTLIGDSVAKAEGGVTVGGLRMKPRFAFGNPDPINVTSASSAAEMKIHNQQIDRREQFDARIKAMRARRDNSRDTSGRRIKP